MFGMGVGCDKCGDGWMGGWMDRWMCVCVWVGE